ncbi:MAG: hypothetical protein PHH75_05575 [Candidatus Omnitrophica bacterium]|nr:hypothetical protein [Candidatus Omnitrophota bacterium]
MKALMKIVVLFLLFLSGIVLFREPIVKVLVDKVGEQLTGFSVEVGRLKLGIRESVVDIGDMKVYNPAGFDDRIFLDIPALYVRYDLGKVLKGAYDLNELALYIREFQVVKKADGTSNVGRLKDSIVALKPKQEGPAKLPPVRVKTLQLRVDKVVLRDYSVVPASVKTYDINLDKKFENIDDPKNLIRVILVESLLKSGVKDLADINVKGLSDSVTSVLKTGTDLVSQTTRTAQDVAMKTVDQATGIVKETVGLFGGLLHATNTTDSKKP